ncbi:MAG: GH36-type glycosyl hydrolase domain-containing protein [Candidatus Thorarchaeota archaeon]
MTSKPYGSGYFGEWIKDEFDLPAYRYTCDQTTDPKAVSPMTGEWRANTDHLHQVGNDRLVAVASNYGQVQVRQDEGSPKFLNDYDPSRFQYGGGIGYLTDGETVLSTFYTGKADSFERIFGMGYFRKTVKDNSLVADQIIFAPFGDEPLVVSQVTIKNERDKDADLRWIEYWGCQQYQFSFKSFMMSIALKKPTSDIRREFSRRFDHKTEVIKNNRGLLNSKRFKGNTMSDKVTWKALNRYLATKGKHLTGGAVKAPIKETVLEDETPPATFLVSLDAPADDMGTDVMSFFGEGGVGAPDGVQEALSMSATKKAETGFLMERKLNLAPGEEQTLYFIYGYLPEGFTLDSFVAKFEKDPSSLLAKSCEQWKANRIQLITDDEWVDRELSWHNYYLRSNLTFDSFFNEHILSQGHMYQYIIGIQAAARDPLQHALPFVFSQPEIVKNIIRYTLKTVTPEGNIPYGIVGHGMYMPSPWRPSDQQLWLLWLTSEYVLANRDIEFLDETISVYPIYGKKTKQSKVRDLLNLCFRYFIDTNATGKHGLARLSYGDWNDMVVHGYVPQDRRDEVTEVGESILNASMATYVLNLYSKLLTYIGELDLAQESFNFARKQQEAVKEQWNGDWFKRAWLSDTLGWVGTDIMWLEPQPWTIIGGAADQNQVKVLLKSINEGARRFSKHGAVILSEPLEKMAGKPGIGTNAGVWLSINGTLVWALALIDSDMAWEEWKRNTLSKHAEEYPDVWYGIWSGPDVYNSEFSDKPGETIVVEERGGVSDALEEDQQEEEQGFMGVGWTDFPVMNMHPHAWPVYSAAKLLGIEFTISGVDFSPSLPFETYRFTSPLLELEKSKSGYSGRYSPSASGTWTINIKLSDKEPSRISKLLVNEKESELVLEEDRLIIRGDSTREEPLIWRVEY